MSATVDPTFLDRVIRREGFFEPDQLVQALRVTKTELAEASGSSRDAVTKTRWLYAPATQTRFVMLPKS